MAMSRRPAPVEVSENPSTVNGTNLHLDDDEIDSARSLCNVSKVMCVVRYVGSALYQEQDPSACSPSDACSPLRRPHFASASLFMMRARAQEEATGKGDGIPVFAICGVFGALLRRRLAPGPCSFFFPPLRLRVRVCIAQQC